MRGYRLRGFGRVRTSRRRFRVGVGILQQLLVVDPAANALQFALQALIMILVSPDFFDDGGAIAGI